ncbi:T9SS type A sorting domain-containing protein [candidate division WOR-3 bacterium]|nr:T9SS type A sorting domain-containing protein [candidate division WOR-3 bacterium]
MKWGIFLVTLSLAIGLYGKINTQSVYPSKSPVAFEYKSTGGPDNYGYTWIDSDEAGGPEFNWIDITTIGTEFVDLDDDEIRGPFPIGFEFPYYWYKVNQFYFSTNGAMSFSDNVLYHVWPSMGYTTQMPSPTRPNDIVVPLGGDLIFGTDGGGSAYYWSNNVDTFIVSWIEVPEWFSDSLYHGSHTFQIILSKEDSCITLQYGPQLGTFMCGTADDPKTAIGIENSSGNIGLQYLWDNSPADNMYEENLAIKFIPPITGSSVKDVSTIAVINEESRGMFLTPDDTLYPWVQIKNLGNQTAAHFKTFCKIDDGSKNIVYSDSVSITTLEPGEVDTVDMPSSWVPQVAGTYTGYGYIVLDGDMAVANDSSNVELQVINIPGYLSYDDGWADNAWAYHYAGNAWANKFTPPEYPARINEVSYYIWGEDWPDPGGNDMIVWVLDDDGIDGSPGTILYIDTLLDVVIRDAWNYVELDSRGVIIEDGSFYVAYVQYSDNPYCPGLACDDTPPFSRQAWDYTVSLDEWDPDVTQLYDWMIRAYMDVPFNVDAELTSINSPGEVVDIGEVITPQITVGNAGLNTISFSAHLIIDSLGSLVYDEEMSVNDLEPDSLRDIDFPVWTSGGAGCQYTITSWVYIAGDGNTSNDTLSMTTMVAGGDYLVWDPDPNHSSGPVIDSLLEGLGYAGYYTQNILDIIGFLSEYVTIYICCGQYPNVYQIADGSVEADSLLNYISNGGKLYIEGGDVWWYDPTHGGFDFNSYFGDTAISDGSTAPVSSVTGAAGSLFEGMSFTYSGESRYSDRVASKGCTIGFLDESGDSIGWYYVNPTLNSRTFGFSVELAGLVDGDFPSTKQEVLRRIYEFFLTGIEEVQTGPKKFAVSCLPNPVIDYTVLRFQLPEASPVSIKIYDITGREVNTLYEGKNEKGIYNIRWNCLDTHGSKIPSGVYFAKFDLGRTTFSQRLVVVR